MAGKAIYAALLAVQQELKAPKSQNNSFGKYKYRSTEDIVEAVKPLLAENGLILNMTDEVMQVANRIYIKATVSVIDIANGDVVASSALARESESKKGMDDSQVTGTASSYARKYALNGLFAIDDTRDADTNEYHNQQQNKNGVLSSKEERNAIMRSLNSAVFSAGASKDDLVKIAKVKFGKTSTNQMSNAQVKDLADNLVKYMQEQGLTKDDSGTH